MLHRLILAVQFGSPLLEIFRALLQFVIDVLKLKRRGNQSCDVHEFVEVALVLVARLQDADESAVLTQDGHGQPSPT